jgi:hypothetical protein
MLAPRGLRLHEARDPEVPRIIFREPLRIGQRGSVSKVEIAALIALIYKALFPSISTFETPPEKRDTVSVRSTGL